MRRAAVFVLALLSAGCERGCLSTWLAERGVGTAPQGPVAPSKDRAHIALSSVDCPDGMARCGDGIVEGSRAYHYDDPCKGSPEQCQCPWERLGDCPHGCAADGVELDVPRERALEQLCAPPPGASLSRPPSPDATASACEDDYVCAGGVVVACGPPAVAVAACTKGCAREGQAIDDEQVTREAATAVLCRR